jgi:proteasome lid subunit RPN8/RPN11
LTKRTCMTLRLSTQHLEVIRQHGSRDYPSECCGIMLGHSNGDLKEVTEVIPLKNLRRDPEKARELLPLDVPGAESERNRFLIDPKDQVRVEKNARARSLDVLGYYHSHPDHPARPSEYDREHAWPWYSYVIISVQQGKAGEFNSWVLADDRSQFEPERVEVPNP